jgi:hypothetical protein
MLRKGNCGVPSAANYVKNKDEKKLDEKNKQEVQQQKKHKGPQAENVSALREALSAVLQGVEAPVRPPQNVKPQQTVETPPPKSQPQTSPAISQNLEAPPSKGESKPQPKLEPKQEKPKEKPAPELPEEQKEVPEEILKHILEIDR